jgi:hypothetical protein
VNTLAVNMTLYRGLGKTYRGIAERYNLRKPSQKREKVMTSYIRVNAEHSISEGKVDEVKKLGAEIIR